MSSFRVGQKVVCVDATVWLTDGKTPSPKTESGLVEGRVYLISSIRHYPDLRYRGHVGHYALSFEEGVRQKNWANHIGYAAGRFRPVAERKTDISVFKAMLSHSNTKVTA